MNNIDFTNEILDNDIKLFYKTRYLIEHNLFFILNMTFIV